MKMTPGYLQKIRVLIRRSQTDGLPITSSERTREGQQFLDRFDSIVYYQNYYEVFLFLVSIVNL